ncbi:hypothetical protein [Elioraea tepidiphila]|uniref:DUF7673 family protein n=1 Tax=Elioraea tepidiphila TaxID=457934 RepID=UPI002FDAFC54
MTDLPEPRQPPTLTRDELAAMYPAPEPMQAHERDALERLIVLAQGDTGQSRRVAAFLLAWWNAGAHGGFDLADLWGLDREIVADVVTVFGLIARVHSYPDALGYEADFTRLARTWRTAARDA